MTKLKACSLKSEETWMLVPNQACESAIHSSSLGLRLLISNGQNAHPAGAQEGWERPPQNIKC